MQLCLDARMINSSGIGTYIKNIIPFLVNEFNLILIGDSYEIKQVFPTSLIDNVKIINCSAPIYSLAEQIKLPLLIPACDIFWTPHINVPIFPIKARLRIVTIMDMFHSAHLNELSLAKKIYTKIIVGQAVRKASLIFTISEYSKKEIIRFTNINKDKINIVRLGIDLNYFKKNNDLVVEKAVKEKYSLPENFILFVGNVKPHKNLKNLLLALCFIVESNPEFKLVIVGKKDGFITGDNGLEDIIAANNLADKVIFTGFASSIDLPIIYSAASIFCFPSLYEGFGFPPLEAMACGVPTAVSNRTSIPEVCGNASVYFDPTSPQDIAKCVLNTLNNPELKFDLIERGYKKVLEYTWLNCFNSHFKSINGLNGFDNVKLQLCLDARMINSSGIGTYIKNLIPYLANEFKLILIGNEREIIKNCPSHILNKIDIINCKAAIYSLKEQFLLPLIIPTCDIFWTPHFNVPILPIRARKRIITVHDIFHLVHLNQLSFLKKLYTLLIFNRAVKKASIIITVSNYSKKEIIKYTSCKEEKVYPIKSGIDFSYFKKNRDVNLAKSVGIKYNLPDKFILYVGNVKPHKNLKNLLHALKIIINEDLTYKLVIVGKKDGFITGDKELNEIIKDNHLTDHVIFTGYADSLDLPIIYSLASVFCFPSMYEGFGFPPLEAMACDVPTVVSNSTSIPEICGEASIYVDGLSPISIAEGILRISNNSALRLDMVSRGRKKIIEYNWKDSAKAHIDVLKNIIYQN